MRQRSAVFVRLSMFIKGDKGVGAVGRVAARGSWATAGWSSKTTAELAAKITASFQWPWSLSVGSSHLQLARKRASPVTRSVRLNNHQLPVQFFPELNAMCSLDANMERFPCLTIPMKWKNVVWKATHGQLACTIRKWPIIQFRMKHFALRNFECGNDQLIVKIRHKQLSIKMLI